jgi:hypothetical protein
MLMILRLSREKHPETICRLWELKNSALMIEPSDLPFELKLNTFRQTSGVDVRIFSERTDLPFGVTVNPLRKLVQKACGTPTSLYSGSRNQV